MFKTTLIRSIVAIALAALAPAVANGLPAFPGAEGFGSETPGGRGGRVIAVTTLDDSGPGSLRDAVAAKGPRTIVFRVAGTIPLKSHLRVTEPFVTIAGQTAPGGGILLRDAGFYIETHDVVIRFIRCRVGPSIVAQYNTQDGLHVGAQGEVYNVVVDHCSFSWSIDEVSSVRGPAHDITFSWNILAEGLRRPFTKEQIGEDRSHSMACLLGGTPTRCTLHHNLLALCNSRNPRIQGGRHAFLNNVVYGWGSITGMFSRNPEVNFIANYYKPGPFSRPIKPISEQSDDMGRIYVKGNCGPDRPDDSLPDWELTVNAPADKHQANQPFDMAPVSVTSADEAYEGVLAGAGAAVPERDAVDRRIIRNTRLAMGQIIDRPEQVGGYPAIKNGPSPADADSDGMPDDWELAQGFDPNDPKDAAGDADHDGYTNLEHYLDYLAREGLRPRGDVASLLVEAPDAPPDPPIEVTAGDAPLPVVSLPGEPATFYAHAWLHDQVPIKVRSRLVRSGPMSLQPARYRDRVQTGPGSLQFTAVEPGPRVILMGPGFKAPRLFLFLDAFGDSSDSDDKPLVIDARQYGVTYGRSNITTRLQAAIDAAVKAGGGIVYIPTGEHEITGLRIPSRVTLHLDRTTVLYWTAEPGVPAGIILEGVENAGLAGPGALDGRSSAGARRAPLVLARNAKSIHIRNLVIRNSSGPSLQVDNCEDVTLSGCKLLAAPARSSTGGLHLGNSRRVTCEDSFISAQGDALTIVAAAANAGPADGITIRQTILDATSTALRIGPQSDAPIRNIRVESLDVANAPRGVLISQKGDGAITGLSFRDMTMNLYTAPGDVGGGIPFQIVSMSRSPDAGIRDVLFEGIQANAYRHMTVQAPPGAPIRDLRIWGLKIRAEADRKAIGDTEPQALFEFNGVQDAHIAALSVTWPAQKNKLWSGLIRSERTDKINFDPNQARQQTRPAGD